MNLAAQCSTVLNRHVLTCFSTTAEGGQHRSLSDLVASSFCAVSLRHSSTQQQALEVKAIRGDALIMPA